MVTTPDTSVHVVGNKFVVGFRDENRHGNLLELTELFVITHTQTYGGISGFVGLGPLRSS